MDVVLCENVCFRTPANEFTMSYFLSRAEGSRNADLTTCICGSGTLLDAIIAGAYSYILVLPDGFLL